MNNEQHVHLKVRDWQAGFSQPDPERLKLSPQVLHYFACFIRDMMTERGEDPGLIHLSLSVEVTRFVSDLPTPTPKEPGHE